MANWDTLPPLSLASALALFAPLSVYPAAPTAHALLIGNGAGALATLAPGAARRVAISDGTDWTSRALLAADLPDLSATYLVDADIGVSVQGYSANTTLLGNSTTGTGNIVLATAPTLASPVFTGVASIDEGLVGTPSFAFASDLDTGIYHSGANQFAITVGGVKIFTAIFSGTTRQVTVGDGSGIGQLLFTGGAGSVRDLSYQTGANPRVILRLDSTAEGGSNAGSNFVILTRADDGSALNANAFSILRSTGQVGINVAPTGIGARLHVGGSTDIVQLLVRGHSTQTSDIVQVQRSSGSAVVAAITDAGLITHTFRDAGTNAVVIGAVLDHASSGTPAAGYGDSLALRLQSSTTASQDAARLRWYWNTATHASRKAYAVLSAYDTAERDVIGWGANGSVGLFGVFDKATAPAAQSAGWAVTNPNTRKTFDTTTITLQQLAEVVGTLITRDISYGLSAA